MSVQVEKLEKNMAKLTVEVPAENVEKAIQGAYNKMKKSINIPGFRKGKAPRQLIEKMYGKEVFYNDAIDAMLPSAYSDAVEAYHEIIKNKKLQKNPIDSQFQYNTYIRDFFNDNKDKTLKQAIACWKYKKGLRGNNKYERSDLIALSIYERK